MVYNTAYAELRIYSGSSRVSNTLLVEDNKLKDKTMQEALLVEDNMHMTIMDNIGDHRTISCYIP